MAETQFDDKLGKAARFCEQNPTLAGVGLLLILGLPLLLILIFSDSGSKPGSTSTASGNFSSYYINCKDMTRSLVKYPSSFDTPFGDVIDSSDFYDRTGIVRVHFSSKNAFGMEIAGISRCKIVNGQLILADAELEDGTRIY